MTGSIAIRFPAPAIRLREMKETDFHRGVDWVPVLFVISLIAILGFAGMDTYLNLKYPVKVAVELNPMARWLLRVSDNDLALFMAVKWVGTCLALCVLVFLYRHRRDMALAASGTLAVCVTTMLIFMIA
jgi:hypothetical protein